MPIFEYKCSDCGNTFEVLAISKQDVENIQCPTCKSCHVQKMMSSGATLSPKLAAAPSPFGPNCAEKGGFS